MNKRQTNNKKTNSAKNKSSKLLGFIARTASSRVAVVGEVSVFLYQPRWIFNKSTQICVLEVINRSILISAWADQIDFKPQLSVQY